RISGPVLGVVEIVQDLAADYEKVFHYQMVVPISCTMILSALFLVLTLVVRHGEKTMQRRAGEELKLKERLNRAERLSSMGEMTAGISHEIRNPLGIILSSAELLKKKMETLDPSNAFPDIIIQESTRLNNIISDFINFARPRSPNPMPCRVEDVLDRSLTFLASQAEKEGFIIRKRIRDEPPEIIADADLLYQAFLNILINAMQAMKNAGGIISIEAGANGGVVEIFFDDEGNGIPEEIVEKIWDPFFTTKEKGSGLGLGIVRNIIESHGGTIRAENRPGTGARVIVELPVNQEES
ncbi:MAG: two-component sensor histidine kinase, partial [Desulfobacterales bacterium]|nr:two-component sensor histidine kinase [Desulfobacterales bacterium]